MNERTIYQMIYYTWLKTVHYMHFAFQVNKNSPEKVSLGGVGYKSDHERIKDTSAIGERVDEDTLSLSTSPRGALHQFLTRTDPSSPHTNDVSLELTLSYNHASCT